MSTLKFSSTDQALQHLADLTGKRIKVADLGFNVGVPRHTPDQPDPDKWTLKDVHHELEENYDFKLVTDLLKRKEVKPNNETLSSAIYVEEPEIIQLILDAGVKPTERQKQKITEILDKK